MATFKRLTACHGCGVFPAKNKFTFLNTNFFLCDTCNAYEIYKLNLLNNASAVSFEDFRFALLNANNEKAVSIQTQLLLQGFDLSGFETTKK